MPNDKLEPEVPVPTPAKISPVAFSITVTFIIFELNLVPSKTSDLTSSKKFNDLILFIDLEYKISLNGSPSSISI